MSDNEEIAELLESIPEDVLLAGVEFSFDADYAPMLDRLNELTDGAFASAVDRD